MNRRRSKRLTRRLKVTVISESRSFQSYTGNISLSGISVKTLRPLPNDTSVMIELTLPSGDTVSIPGIVKWDFTIPVHGFHKNGMGIQFTERSEQYEAFIRDMYSGNEEEHAGDFMAIFQTKGSGTSEDLMTKRPQDQQADAIAFCTEDYPKTYFEEDDCVTVIRTEHGKIMIHR